MTIGNVRGRSLKLFLVDGSPSGVMTAELGVSSMRAVVASRTALPELLRRDEASLTGVYLIIGPDPALPGRQLVYVGEGDQVKTRLAAHDSDDQKDFFTRAVIIVSKDENLTKVHCRYLESRIIAAVRNAGRAKLVNGTEPPIRGLPESEVADMERVLDEIEILLPVIGFDVLRAAGHESAEHLILPKNIGSTSFGETPDFTTKPPTLNILSQQRIVFAANIKQASARAIERAGEFVVLKGSTAYLKFQESLSFSLRSMQQALRESGILVPDTNPDLLRFNQDVSFGSPSAASSLISGFSDSGPRAWKVEGTGQSYRDWRKHRIDT